MNTRLSALVAGQGYFLTRDALAAGMTESAFYRHVRNGTIVKVRHGTYSLPNSWNDATPSAQHLSTVRSVLQRAGADHVVSHASAAILHTDAWWGLDLSNVHLTRRLPRSERRESGVTHHRSQLPDDHVALIDGIPLTVPARTAIEVACSAGAQRSLVLMNGLLREAKTTTDELTQMADYADRWPGSLAARVPLALATGMSGSVGEDRCLFHFWQGGVPRPALQHPVFDDGGHPFAYLDFWWEEERIAGEFDGMHKYRTLLRPGQTPADALIAEKRREDAIREILDCRFLRFDWTDLHRPQERIVARFHRMRRRG